MLLLEVAVLGEGQLEAQRSEQAGVRLRLPGEDGVERVQAEPGCQINEFQRDRSM